MRRYTNWSLILFMGILAVAVVFSNIWIPEVQNSITEEDTGPVFDCPNYVTDDQCDEIANIAEVDTELANDLIDALDPDNDLPPVNQPSLSDAARALNDNTSDEPQLSEVKRGQFQDMDVIREANGQVFIYEVLFAGELAGRLVRFEEGFEIISGPDLEFFLSTDRDVRTPDELFASDPIEVAFLLGNVGAQTFELSTDINLADYRSVVIYSAEYDLIVAIAPIFTN